MVKYLCDSCSTEVLREDLCVLRIEKERKTPGKTDYDFVPVTTPLEVCVFCKEKIVKFLNELKNE